MYERFYFVYNCYKNKMQIDIIFLWMVFVLCIPLLFYGVAILIKVYMAIKEQTNEHFLHIINNFYVSFFSFFFFVVGIITLGIYPIKLIDQSETFYIFIKMIICIAGGIFLYLLISKIVKIHFHIKTKYIIIDEKTKRENLLKIANQTTSMYGAIIFYLGVFCEEILWRGFLIITLQSFFNLDLIVAIFISSISFGMNHYYLGTKGLLINILNGIIFSVIFIVADGVIYSFITHTVYNILAVRNIRRKLR